MTLALEGCGSPSKVAEFDATERVPGDHRAAPSPASFENAEVSECEHDAGDDDDEPPLPERVLTAAQRQAQVAEIRSNRDFAAVLDFLEVFEHPLQLRTEFGINELEEALVLYRGAESSVLSDLSMELLCGVSPSVGMSNDPWQCVLAKRLARLLCFDGHRNPFAGAPPRHAPAIYATLTGQARAALLRALCELRCDRYDLRGVIDLAHKSVAQQIKLRTNSLKRPRGEVVTYQANQFSRGAWGQDHEGRQYWLYDMGLAGGVRLCRETPPPAPEKPPPPGRRDPRAPLKAAKTVSQLERDADAGAWETLACSTDEIEAVGKGLMRSGKKSGKTKDVRLGRVLAEQLVEELRKREAAEACRTEALERQRLQMEALVTAGRLRRMRDRKQVCYTYDGLLGERTPQAVEPLTEAAPPRKRRLSPPYLPPPGVRRGRSAAAIPPGAQPAGGASSSADGSSGAAADVGAQAVTVGANAPLLTAGEGTVACERRDSARGDAAGAQPLASPSTPSEEWRAAGAENAAGGELELKASCRTALHAQASLGRPAGGRDALRPRQCMAVGASAPRAVASRIFRG